MMLTQANSLPEVQDVADITAIANSMHTNTISITTIITVGSGQNIAC